MTQTSRSRRTRRGFIDRLLAWLFPPRVTQYSIPRSVLERMAAFAHQTHPKEMIALLRGSHDGDTLVVEDLVFQPFDNDERSATIHIDYSLTDVVGTFHSHPVPDDRPSAADKRLFADHPGIHVIMAWPYEDAAVYSHRARPLGRERVPLSAASFRRGARGGFRSRQGNR